MFSHVWWNLASCNRKVATCNFNFWLFEFLLEPVSKKFFGSYFILIFTCLFEIDMLNWLLVMLRYYTVTWSFIIPSDLVVMINAIYILLISHKVAQPPPPSRVDSDQLPNFASCQLSTWWLTYSARRVPCKLITISLDLISPFTPNAIYKFIVDFILHHIL